MAGSFKRFGISDDELMAEIRSSAEVDAALNDFMANEVVPYWRSVSPMLKEQPGADKRDPGAYIASVKVTKKARNGVGAVGATIWYAHFVEDGTRRGSPEFAPGQKTAAHFGGTLDRGSDEPKQRRRR